MNEWEIRPIPFRFQISDWILFSVSLPLQVRIEHLSNTAAPVEQPLPPESPLANGSQGFGIRNLPITTKQPTLSVVGNFLRYIPLQYPHCYIDLRWPFDRYLEKFSSKTRSTIQRKIRKFKKYCGDQLLWKTYTKPADIPEFFEQARQVSSLTYQERLLDAGLPQSEEFLRNSVALAADDRLRAFILFHQERPVSYLYCPGKDGVLEYAYLGYDPEYRKWSVGTILQWLAIEQIFLERKFHFFDFTEGQSNHKQLFASHQRQCANVFFVKKTPANTLLIHLHRQVDRLSAWLGSVFDRYGLKTKVKKLLRRA